MTFEEAIRKSVQAYYRGAGFDSYDKAAGEDTKYNQSYFDTLASDMKRGQSKKKKPIEEDIEMEMEEDLD